MNFNPYLEKVPYNKALLLRHNRFGIGIGAIRESNFRASDGRVHLTVSFAHVTKFADMAGASTPTPVEAEDITGWAEYPDDKPYEEMSVSLPLLLNLQADARFAAVYGSEEKMTNTLDDIANKIDLIVADLK